MIPTNIIQATIYTIKRIVKSMSRSSWTKGNLSTEQ